MKTMNGKFQKLLHAVLVAMALMTTSLFAQRLNTAVTSSGEIIFGGPTLEEAKKALEDRISQQSEGKIWILNFLPTKTKIANVDLKGKSYCEFGFEAQVEFAEPSRWAVRYDGKPLTFNLLKTNQLSTVFNGKNPFNISTNSGGTMELCSRDADGCDKNSAAHYRVMSDFFHDATVLVRPADSSKQAIRNSQSLAATIKNFESLTAALRF